MASPKAPTAPVAMANPAAIPAPSLDMLSPMAIESSANADSLPVASDILSRKGLVFASTSTIICFAMVLSR